MTPVESRCVPLGPHSVTVAQNRRRTSLLSRTRAQSTCILVAHLPYFSNTCGHLAAIPHAFCIRVRRIHRLRKSGNTLASAGPRDFGLQQKRRIPRARVQTKVLTDVSYSKPSLFIEEYVIFLRHGTACCVFGNRCIFRTRVQSTNTNWLGTFVTITFIRRIRYIKDTRKASQVRRSNRPAARPAASQPASQPASQLASHFNTYL